MDSLDNYRLHLEIFVRFILLIMYACLGSMQAFQRKIQPEELWLYKYPITGSYVPQQLLWPLIFFIPLTSIFIAYQINNNASDVQEAILAFTLTMGLTATTTDIIKLVSGRVRPDFYWRCFPGEIGPGNSQYKEKRALINEGRKSFPSGHSSLSFASFGFSALYLMAKLGIFNENGRGQAWRLIICMMPIVIAMLISLSRSCDYHHHAQDIIAGAGIGLLYAYLCYRQYYPSVEVSGVPYRTIH